MYTDLQYITLISLLMDITKNPPTLNIVGEGHMGFYGINPLPPLPTDRCQ
jgi:hypothetical protein